MTRHKKHDDNLDVQIRTKILDQYGNPIEGAIEYDPATGYGKRIKDPTLGLVEDFYAKDGSLEIDGQNFDDTNHDPDEVDSIKEMINLRVSRNDPSYHDMLKEKVNQKKGDKNKAQQLVTISPDLTIKPAKFIATTQIAKGEEIIIDLATGEAKGTRSDNIHRPSDQDATTKAESKTKL